MQVCIEGPEILLDEKLEDILNHWKEQKVCSLVIWLLTMIQFDFIAMEFLFFLGGERGELWSWGRKFPM